MKLEPQLIVEPCVFELAGAFNSEFQYIDTQLSPGAEEPFYQAANSSNQAIIFSNQDFFSSALHEIAHWCIAGEQRRKLDDYGYWYAPDGRTEKQQAEFYNVEVKPQALEWAFHLAAALPFEFSLDNLNQEVCHQLTSDFKAQVYRQLANYFEQGFPSRALQMIQLLSRRYNSCHPIRLPQAPGL